MATARDNVGIIDFYHITRIAAHHALLFSDTLRVAHRSQFDTIKLAI